MRTYRTYNGVGPTTADITPVTTGTALKTMLQISPPATLQAVICAWGCSFDGTPTGQTNNTPGRIELIETDVAATVTTQNAAGMVKMSDSNGIASNMTLGTANTGFTATVEGATTVARLIDYQQVPPTGPFVMQWPLGNYPMITASKFLRVRVLFAVAVNMICWVEWAEG